MSEQLVKIREYFIDQLKGFHEVIKNRMLLDPQKDILKHKSMKDLINLMKTINLALIHNVFAISET